VLIVQASPKKQDLLRDGRFALHSFPPVDVDDEFYLAGRARHQPDPATRAAVIAASKAHHLEDDDLFELDIERALLAIYGPRPSWPPAYRTWRAR
jgi:hypothetical protein